MSGPQEFGSLTGSLLAAGWKGLHVLTDKGDQRCSLLLLVPVFLAVPSAGPCWVSQVVRSQSWGFSMFPFFCHLRDFCHHLEGTQVALCR